MTRGRGDAVHNTVEIHIGKMLTTSCASAYDIGQLIQPSCSKRFTSDEHPAEEKKDGNNGKFQIICVGSKDSAEKRHGYSQNAVERENTKRNNRADFQSVYEASVILRCCSLLDIEIIGDISGKHGKRTWGKESRKSGNKGKSQYNENTELIHCLHLRHNETVEYFCPDQRNHCKSKDQGHAPQNILRFFSCLSHMIAN